MTAGTQPLSIIAAKAAAAICLFVRISPRLPLTQPLRRIGKSRRPRPSKADLSDAQVAERKKERTNSVHIRNCQLSQASGGGHTFRALRIPVIRSAREKFTDSRFSRLCL